MQTKKRLGREYQALVNIVLAEWGYKPMQTHFDIPDRVKLKGMLRDYANAEINNDEPKRIARGLGIVKMLLT